MIQINLLQATTQLQINVISTPKKNNLQYGNILSNNVFSNNKNCNFFLRLFVAAQSKKSKICVTGQHLISYLMKYTKISNRHSKQSLENFMKRNKTKAMEIIKKSI